MVKKVIARNVTTKGSVLIATVLPWVVSAIWFILMWSLLKSKGHALGLNWYTPLLCIPPLALFLLWSKLFVNTVRDFVKKPRNMVLDEGSGLRLQLSRHGDSRYIPYSAIEKCEFVKEKNRSGDTPNGTLVITLRSGEKTEVGIILDVEEASKYIGSMI